MNRSADWPLMMALTTAWALWWLLNTIETLWGMFKEHRGKRDESNQLPGA